MNKGDLDTYGYAYFIKFLDYFIKKNMLGANFNMQDFVGNKNHPMRRFRFRDIDMGAGWIRYAFAYGHHYKYIVDLSSKYRVFDLVKLRSDGLI